MIFKVVNSSGEELDLIGLNTDAFAFWATQRNIGGWACPENNEVSWQQLVEWGIRGADSRLGINFKAVISLAYTHHLYAIGTFPEQEAKITELQRVMDMLAPYEELFKHWSDRGYFLIKG